MDSYFIWVKKKYSLNISNKNEWHILRIKILFSCVCGWYFDFFFKNIRTIQNRCKVCDKTKYIMHGIALGKNKWIYAKQEIKFLRLEIEDAKIIL